MSGFFSWWKPVVFGLLVFAIGLVGWRANGWRMEAKAAETLRLELRNELERRIAEQVKTKQVDAARLAAEAKLQAAEEAISKGVKTVKQTVVKYVKENPDCDLPELPASQLQHLREGGE
jgi:flagellar biosynthesis/type III secretory pathway M-ring protein FliF/YscJ